MLLSSGDYSHIKGCGSLNLKALEFFSQSLLGFLQACMFTCVVVFTFGQPLYLILKSKSSGWLYSSTHANQYNWVLTNAYLEGVPAALLLFAVWVLCAAVLFWKLLEMDKYRRKLFDSEKMCFSELYSPFTGRLVMRLASLIALDVVVCSSLYALYIYIVSLNISIGVLAFTQIMCAIIKLVWNRAASRFFKLFFESNKLKYGAYLTSIVFVFNNVFLMCIVTLLTDSSCFLYAFTPQHKVSSSYTVETCVDWLVGREGVSVYGWVWVHCAQTPCIAYIVLYRCNILMVLMPLPPSSLPHYTYITT